MGGFKAEDRRESVRQSGAGRSRIKGNVALFSRKPGGGVATASINSGGSHSAGCRQAAVIGNGGGMGIGCYDWGDHEGAEKLTRRL